MDSTYSWMIWLIATTYVFFQFILQMSPGVMTHSWIHDFHTNRNGVSYLSAAFYYSYLVLQIPAGLLYDRYGPRKTLTFAATALAVGSFWMAFSHTYHAALFARAMMGVGGTFAFVGMLYLMTKWFSPRRFPTMVGLSEMVAMITTALGTVGFAYLVMHAGWRTSMIISGILSVIAVIVVFSVIRDKPTDANEILIEENELSIRKQIKLVITNKQVWYAGLYGFAAFSIMNAFAALWATPFFRAVYHLPLDSAAAITSMALIGVAAGGPTLGKLSEKYGHTRSLLIGSIFMAAILLLIVIYDTSLPRFMLYILVFLTGAGCSGYILCFDITKQNTPSKIHGTAMACCNMIIMTSAPILQSLMGYMLHSHIFGLSHTLEHSFQITMTLLPVIFVISILFAFLMRENRPT